MNKKYIPIPNKHAKPPFPELDNLGKFKKAWKYHNANGDWVYCVACYVINDKRFYYKFIYTGNSWEIEDIPNNNFLYNLSEIKKNKDKPVLILDEELGVDFFDKVKIDDFIKTTWTGNQYSNTDYSLLKNRKVYYFSSSYVISGPVINFFKRELDNCIVVDPLVERTGWNIVDDLGDMKIPSETIVKWINNYDKTLAQKKEEKKQEFVDQLDYPFQLLGYSDGFMYFLPHETGQIFKVRQGSLNNSHLIFLAPLSFWKNGIYGYESKRGGINISWPEAIDDITRALNLKGPFQKENIRGRGIWMDHEKNIFVHTGKYLISKDGNKKLISDVKMNGYVYERLPELKLDINTNVDKINIDSLKKCFNNLSVKTKLQLNFLIGWSVLAPFCGALSWRPHIWITGGAGTGKSTVVKMIVHKMLGPFKTCPLSNSTAPGMMQYQKNDSLSIVYDEAEPSTETKNNIKAILDIARAGASSSEDEKMMKGTADQTGKIYNITYMFCLSSINTMFTQKSDRSRFSVINMTKNIQIPWKKLSAMIVDTFSDDNCKDIRSYIFKNWNIVNHNITNFRNAAGAYLGDMRQGDQAGTLLAGSVSLLNMKKYEYNNCYDICERYLTEYQQEDENVNDELECMIKIFTTKIRYTNISGKQEDVNLLSLCHIASGKEEENTTDNRKSIHAKKELYKYGINYNLKKQKIYIACNYEWLRNILRETPWGSCYSKVLQRLDYVSEKTVVTGFGYYYNGRAIEIDAKYILRLSDDTIYTEAGF